MADNQVKIILSALDQTKSAFDSVRGSFRSLESQSKSSLFSISAEWKKLAGTIGSVFGAYQITGYLKDVATASARYETLGVAMIQVGKNSGYTAEQLEGVSQSLQKQGISMTESRQQVMRMVQAQLDLNQANKLARIAQDAAVIGNINSSEAFDRMIQGIRSGEVEVLRNIGLTINQEQSYRDFEKANKLAKGSLSESQKIQARANAVMAEGAKIAGTYEESMKTAGKQLTSFPRYLEDFKVKMGEAFNPATAQVIGSLTTVMKQLQDEISSPRAKAALTALSEEFAKLVVNAGEKAPEAMRKTLEGLNSFLTFYNAIPGELVSVGSMGLVGKFLFNNQVGVILASITAINSALSRVGMNLGALPGKYREGAGAMQNIIDAVTGKRDWNTGAYKGGTLPGQADVSGLARAEAEQKRRSSAAQLPGSPPRPFPASGAGGGKSSAGDKSYARLVEQYRDFKRTLEANISTEGLGEFRKALIQNQLEADNAKDHVKGLKGALKDEAYSLIEQERLRKDELSRKKEEEAQRKDGVETEKKAADMRRDIAEAQKEADRRAYEVRENAINQQLYEMDLAEQAGASHRDGLEERIRLTEVLLADQRAYLETIEKAADPSSYYSQVEAINQTRSAILTLRNESDEAQGSFFAGWSKGWKDFREQSVTAFTAARDSVTQFTDSATDYLSNVFFDVIQGKFENLKDYFRSFCMSILKIFTDMLAQMVVKQAASDLGGLFGSIGSLFGLAGGAGSGAAAAAGSSYTASSLGSVFSSGLMFHSGGTVGVTAAPRRFVPALTFAGAPRLHNGLLPDEFPAILQRGETVIPKGQSSANGSLQQNVNVTIVAADAKSFSDMVRRNPSAVIKPITDALRDNSINREWKTLLG